MRALKSNWAGACAGILLGLISLTPYFLAGLKDPSIFPQPGSGGKGFLFFGLVYVYPLLKGFWYWILFGSSVFQTHIFKQLEYGWIQAEGLQLMFKYFWLAARHLIGFAGVILSFYVNYKFFKGNKKVFRFWKARLGRTDNWVVFYTVAAFVSSIIATAVSPTLPIYWHLLFVWPFTLLPLIFFIDFHCNVLAEAKKVKVFICICAVYFTFFNVIAALGSRKHSIYTNFHDTYHSICKDDCRLPPEENAFE